MLKHIQKYNRQILVVVSSLLLVVFLAPSAVTQCSRFNAQPSRRLRKAGMPPCAASWRCCIWSLSRMGPPAACG